jgi:hypothetical protein
MRPGVTSALYALPDALLSTLHAENFSSSAVHAGFLSEFCPLPSSWSGGWRNNPNLGVIPEVKVSLPFRSKGDSDDESLPVFWQAEGNLV